MWCSVLQCAAVCCCVLISYYPWASYECFVRVYMSHICHMSVRGTAMRSFIWVCLYQLFCVSVRGILYIFHLSVRGTAMGCCTRVCVYHVFCTSLSSIIYLFHMILRGTAMRCCIRVCVYQGFGMTARGILFSYECTWYSYKVFHIGLCIRILYECMWYTPFMYTPWLVFMCDLTHSFEVSCVTTLSEPVRSARKVTTPLSVTHLERL